eukprot:7379267-Prymnesium_polylepis.1
MGARGEPARAAGSLRDHTSTPSGCVHRLTSTELARHPRATLDRLAAFVAQAHKNKLLASRGDLTVDQERALKDAASGIDTARKMNEVRRRSLASGPAGVGIGIGIGIGSGVRRRRFTRGAVPLAAPVRLYTRGGPLPTTLHPWSSAARRWRRGRQCRMRKSARRRCIRSNRSPAQPT